MFFRIILRGVRFHLLGAGHLTNGRLCHISAVEFTVQPDEDFTYIYAADGTLAEFQGFKPARCVAVHDLAQAAHAFCS
jgi:hypothetical protein